MILLFTQTANSGIPTRDNISIIGITQEPSTQACYLVFYHEIRSILDRIMQHHKHIRHMRYADFYELKEIGSGGYGTVYTAKYKNYSWNGPETVVLKQFKNFDQTLKLLISEVSSH